MDIRAAIRVDPDTKNMLRDLVDLDQAMHGKSTEGKVVTDLIRNRHRQEFPDEWSGGVYKHYSSRRQKV